MRCEARKEIEHLVVQCVQRKDLEAMTRGQCREAHGPTPNCKTCSSIKGCSCVATVELMLTKSMLDGDKKFMLGSAIDMTTSLAKAGINPMSLVIEKESML